MTLNIPTRRKSVCKLCGQELDIEAPGVHQWVAGWVMNRTGGGGHGISLPKRENLWAHGHCIKRATQGFLKELF
jgi:hypothetical protein